MLIRIDYTRANTGMEMISLNPKLTFLLQTLRKLFINYGSIAKWPSELKLRNSLAEHGCRHLHVGGPTRKGHFLLKRQKLGPEICFFPVYVGFVMSSLNSAKWEKQKL